MQANYSPNRTTYAAVVASPPTSRCPPQFFRPAVPAPARYFTDPEAVELFTRPATPIRDIRSLNQAPSSPPTSYNFLSSSSSAPPMTPLDILSDVSISASYNDSMKTDQKRSFSFSYPHSESDAELSQISNLNRLEIREDVGPSRSTKCRWREDDDEEMTRVLMESVVLGTAGDNGFPQRVWQMVVDAINALDGHKGALKTIRSCQSRYQYLKSKNYDTITSLLKLSGAGWDAETSTVTLSDECWQELAESVSGKVEGPSLGPIDVICSGRVAKGKLAATPAQSVKDKGKGKPAPKRPLEHDDESETEVESSADASNKRSLGTSKAVREQIAKKRKRTNAEVHRDAFTQFTDVSNKMVDILERSFELKERPEPIQGIDAKCSDALLMSRKLQQAFLDHDMGNVVQDVVMDYLFNHAKDINEGWLACPNEMEPMFVRNVWARCREPLSCRCITHGRGKH